MGGVETNPIISNLIKPYPAPDRLKPAKPISSFSHFASLFTKKSGTYKKVPTFFNTRTSRDYFPIEAKLESLINMA